MKRKRIPWPRWAKIARNLLIFCLLALVVWGQLGKPLPYHAALRRTARQNLFPKTEHHAVIQNGYYGYHDVCIDWTEGAAMVSLYEAAAVRPALYPYTPAADVYPLKKGPELLAFPWPVMLPTGKSGLGEAYALYTALFPPEGSTDAVLTLHNTSGTYTVSGQREGEIFIFYARPEADEDGRRSMDNSWFFRGEFTYELAFFDADGNMIFG